MADYVPSVFGGDGSTPSLLDRVFQGAELYLNYDLTKRQQTATSAVQPVVSGTELNTGTATIVDPVALLQQNWMYAAMAGVALIAAAFVAYKIIR